MGLCNNRGNPALDYRPIDFGDRLPQPFRLIWYSFEALAGLLCGFLLMIWYLLFVIYCYFDEKVFCCRAGKWKKQVDGNNPTYRQFTKPSALVPGFVRNASGRMRIRLCHVPHKRRGMWWSTKMRLLQFAAIVEIAPNASSPNNLSAALALQFGGVFPFADGIGIADREFILEELSNQHVRKGKYSLAGRISKPIPKFSRYNCIFLGLDPVNQGEKLHAARRILHAWISHFDFNLDEQSPSFKTLSQKFPKVYTGKLPSDEDLYGVLGDVIYWMATPTNYGLHGQWTREEKNAWHTLTDDLFEFFPSWFNFLVLGGGMVRTYVRALYTIRAAIYRDKGIAYEAAMKAAKDNTNLNIEESEVLRLITVTFGIAAGRVPAVLCAAVLKRIADDPIEMSALYEENKENFIKECARLNPCVFWVNTISSQERSINGVTIPAGTSQHLYLPLANLDASVFSSPLDFDPRRPNLDQIVTWNGLDAAWGIDPNKYPRHCPGRNVAIQAIRLIVDHYIPQLITSVGVSNAIIDSTVTKNLDFATTIMASITCAKSEEWNRAGHYGMNTFNKKNIRVRNFYGFKLPTYDEDFHNKVRIYDFMAWCSTFLPVRDYIWTAADAQAAAWRKVNLRYFPGYNNFNASKLGPSDMNTDLMVTRLAFFGLPCQNTRLCADLNVPSPSSESEWKYVNDTTALGDFEVRKGFLRYGARVYFDDKYAPKEIYVSHFDESYHPGDEKWEFAKWVWEVSMFTFVTIHDHLMVTHLIKANAFVKNTRKYLGKKHLLRTVLKPFTYMTIYINRLAGKTLYCPNGLASRVWAFKDVTGAMRTLHEAYKYDDKFVKLDHQPVEDYPIGTDYYRLNDIFVNYVELTLDQLEPIDQDRQLIKFYQNLVADLRVADEELKKFNRENLVRILSHLIMNGTGIHEHVGHISDYQIFPNMTGAKIVDGMLREPTQSYALNTSLTTSTGIQQPKLLDDWMYLFDQKNIKDESVRTATKENYETFKKKLVAYSSELDSRHDTRFSFQNFNPKLLGTAVSK